MKFINIIKKLFILILIIKTSISFKSFNKNQNLISSIPAKRDYIYYTPTSANIIDPGYSTYVSPITQYSSPYTYSPYYSTPVIYPNTQVPYGYGYSFSPGSSWYYGRKESSSAQSIESQSKNLEKKRVADGLNKFQDVIGEIKGLKLELFGKEDADMKFYRANKNTYFDNELLKRAEKISKVLELEELLDFYSKNTLKTEIPIEKKQSELLKPKTETNSTVSAILRKDTLKEISIEKKENSKEIQITRKDSPNESKTVHQNINKKLQIKENKIQSNEKIQIKINEIRSDLNKNDSLKENKTPQIKEIKENHKIQSKEKTQIKTDALEKNTNNTSDDKNDSLKQNKTPQIKEIKENHKIQSKEKTQIKTDDLEKNTNNTSDDKNSKTKMKEINNLRKN